MTFARCNALCISAILAMLRRCGQPARMLQVDFKTLTLLYLGAFALRLRRENATWFDARSRFFLLPAIVPDRLQSMAHSGTDEYKHFAFAFAERPVWGAQAVKNLCYVLPPLAASPFGLFARFAKLAAA